MNENQVTLRQALYETRNGDPARALQMWQEILDRDEHNGPGHHICGLLSMKLEEFELDAPGPGQAKIAVHAAGVSVVHACPGPMQVGHHEHGGPAVVGVGEG